VRVWCAHFWSLMSGLLMTGRGGALAEALVRCERGP
jgi:hypothetical protein